ncbi:MAG: ABC transporter ATP-binding protein [Candidatus Ruminococcus intestinipullorum]|nr:ABC transporter ATP-binding protein [Candidatus Ruminococcus intestinipullorum]
MLEVQGLVKSYGKTVAVDEVSFQVSDGQVGVLLGPNGAGKSTIIKSIAGLLRYQGRIAIQGFGAKTIEAKKLFAYVPEIPAMFDALTVREHVEYIRKAYASNITDAEVEEYLRRFDLFDKQDKLGNELSKGMMQKVSICCALAVQPKVLLLDEPMVGLDPKAIRELKEVVLEEKKKGTTILISTHMLEMVEELWDIMFVMEKSKIVASYQKDEVGDRELDELFFSVTGGEKV